MKLIKDMTEPELRQYYDMLMQAMLVVTPPDVDMTMIIQFTDYGIVQYVASHTLENAPEMLRELAGRIENRDTIPR